MTEAGDQEKSENEPKGHATKQSEDLTVAKQKKKEKAKKEKEWLEWDLFSPLALVFCSWVRLFWFSFVSSK